MNTKNLFITIHQFWFQSERCIKPNVMVLKEIRVSLSLNIFYGRSTSESEKKITCHCCILTMKDDVVIVKQQGAAMKASS